ncbi:MAG: hypothetical protein IPL50_05910 [Chitinophagaceae bacterium]|nr:hypothetical protein [Chitinophagaceae bacterium]
MGALNKLTVYADWHPMQGVARRVQGGLFAGHDFVEAENQKIAFFSGIVLPLNDALMPVIERTITKLGWVSIMM